MERLSSSYRDHALRIMQGFAVLYSLLGFASIFYLPAAATERRLLLVFRLGLFFLAVLLTAVFFLLAVRRGEIAGVKAALGLLHSKSLLILLAWFGWAFLACLLAVREGYSTLLFNGGFLLDQLVNFLVLFPLGMVLASRRNDSLWMTLAWTLVLLILPYLLVGLIVAFTNGRISFLGRIIRVQDGRLRLGSNSNTAGIYAAMVFTLGFYLLNRTPSRILRWLLAAEELLLLLVIVATGSRAAMGAVAVGIIYYFAVLVIRRRRDHRNREKRRRAWIWFSGFAVILLLAFLFRRSIPGLEGLIERFSWKVFFSGREQIWKALLPEFFRQPHLMLHGCSSAEVPYLVGRVFVHQWNTHNQFLETAVGQGIPALVLFLGFLGLLFRDSLTVSLRGEERTSGWALPLTLLVLILHSMAEVTLVNSGTTIGSIFFLTAGYVSGMGELSRREKRGDPV